MSPPACGRARPVDLAWLAVVTKKARLPEWLRQPAATRRNEGAGTRGLDAARISFPPFKVLHPNLAALAKYPQKQVVGADLFGCRVRRKARKL